MGPPCAGKHALASELCKRERNLKLLRTITTRPQRSSDLNTEMIFVSNDEFNKRFTSDEFFQVNRKTNVSYAYSKIQLEKELSNGFSIIMAFHYRGGLALKQQIHNIPTIFLVSPIEVLEERCKNRDNWKEANSKDLLKALVRNDKMYNKFITRENKCIRIENIINERPIGGHVVEVALNFWKNLNEKKF